MTALNGRTGLVAFAAVALMSTLFVLFTRFSFVTAVTSALGIGLASWIAVRVLSKVAPQSLNFIAGMFEDSRTLLVDGELTGNYTVLVPDLLRVPENDAQFIFGTGLRLYTESRGLRSDVGFTNDLFAGGLVFVVLAYFTLFIFIARSQSGQTFLAVSMIVVFFIANFKGEFFRSSILIFMVIFLSLINYGVHPSASKSATSGDGRQVQ